MMSSQLLIGRPGHVLSSEDCPDAYSTRVGGQPIYFKEVGKPPSYMTRCDICCSELTLILQVWSLSPLIIADATSTLSPSSTSLSPVYSDNQPSLLLPFSPHPDLRTIRSIKMWYVTRI